MVVIKGWIKELEKERAEQSEVNNRIKSVKVEHGIDTYNIDSAEEDAQHKFESRKALLEVMNEISDITRRYHSKNENYNSDKLEIAYAKLVRDIIDRNVDDIKADYNEFETELNKGESKRA